MRLGVPVIGSLIIGTAAGLTAASGGAQELGFSCAGDHGGALIAEEARGCAEQRFDRPRAGAEKVAVAQFAAALADAEGLRRQFVQADEDGDGRISREEWMRSFGPAHAGTTERPAVVESDRTSCRSFDRRFPALPCPTPISVTTGRDGPEGCLRDQRGPAPK